VYVLHGSPLLADEDPKPLLLSNGLPAVSETDVLAAIQETWPGANVVQPELLPAARYPRIWRGSYWTPTATEIQAFVGASTSANLLRERFRRVLMTIEPEPENRLAFGHELRQLLILASTEVESAWRAVLVANGHPPPGNGRFTTNQYCHLIDPLKLKDWAVELVASPRYGPIAPFREWDRDDPTKSLTWYADHHAAKHNREVNLSKATLGNVISAMAALEIMLAAQVGPSGLGASGSMGAEFQVVQQPDWRLEQQYVPALLEGEAKLVPYPFSL